MGVVCDGVCLASHILSHVPEMRYSGPQIENLTVTKIAFWNAGRDTIDNQDVASAGPFVHVKEGYKILDVKIRGFLISSGWMGYGKED